MFLQWVNDIEGDDKYARWPANVHELLRPAFPGTLRRVRKNFFHLVLMIDPESSDAKHLVETAEIFWANDVPVRIGMTCLNVVKKFKQKVQILLLQKLELIFEIVKPK